MDIEFHYFMTHLIALRAKFKPKDAFTIAYASQYTDDNMMPYKVTGGDAPYENPISQTVDISLSQTAMLGIYPVFHFCPGTKDEIINLSPGRRDGKYHLLATTPDNKNARAIFNDALGSGSFHRIGIATHMYADTFCHRDFVGWKDEFNWTTLEGFVSGAWSALCPAVGHALAMHNPDIPALVWEDQRLTSPFRRKKNKDQILSAAGNIFDFFCLNTKPERAVAIKKTLLGDLGAAIGAEVEADSGALKKKRLASYKDLLGGDYIKYDEEKWFDSAVDRQVDGQTVGTSDVKYTYHWKDNYRKSDWFAFQKAVKTHQVIAFKTLGETFKKMEINFA